MLDGCWWPAPRRKKPNPSRSREPCLTPLCASSSFPQSNRKRRVLAIGWQGSAPPLLGGLATVKKRFRTALLVVALAASFSAGRMWSVARDFVRGFGDRTSAATGECGRALSPVWLSCLRRLITSITEPRDSRMPTTSLPSPCPRRSSRSCLRSSAPRPEAMSRGRIRATRTPVRAAPTPGTQTSRMQCEI